MRRVALCACVWIGILMCSRVDAMATADVVLHAPDAVNLHGNRSRVNDATTAASQLMSSADNGWSSPNATLANLQRQRHHRARRRRRGPERAQPGAARLDRRSVFDHNPVVTDGISVISMRTVRR